MTNWFIRKSGSDSNGGTSAAIRSSGSDGFINVTSGVTFLSSPTAAWTAADIGHAVNLNDFPTFSPIIRLISAVTLARTVSVTTPGAGSTITSAAQFDASMVGQTITGLNIPANSVVTVFNNASSITINQTFSGGATSGTANLGAKLTTTGSVSFNSQPVGKPWVVGGPLLTFSAMYQSRASSFPGALVGAGAAGDNVYIGAGVYRETLLHAASGGAGLPITTIGDTDGTFTGDAGEVRLSAFLTDDKHAPSASVLMALNTQTYLAFSNIVFHGGGGVLCSSTLGGHDYSFTDCTFIAMTSGNNAFTMVAPGTAQALNFLLDRCAVWLMSNATVLAFQLGALSGVTGDVDQNVMIRNSFLLGMGGTGVAINPTTAAFKSGGVRVVGCTILAMNSTGVTLGSAAASVLIPSEVRNCLIFGTTGVVGAAAVIDAIVEDNNFFCTTGARSNVKAGPNSRFGGTPMVDAGQLLQAFGIIGPWLAPQPDSQLRGSGLQPRAVGGVGGVGVGLDARAVPGTPAWFARRGRQVGGQNRPTVALPSVDFLNRPRPLSGPRQTIGFVDVHDNATRDTATTDASTASAKLIGAGDIEMYLPVDASSTTISVRCLYNSAYGSQNFPTLAVVANAEIGVTAQEVAAAAGAWGVWQTITLAAFTPTAKGWVRVRLTSRDDTAVGQVNFDTLAVA